MLQKRELAKTLLQERQIGTILTKCQIKIR
jgi:hypothetical protein